MRLCFQAGPRNVWRLQPLWVLPLSTWRLFSLAVKKNAPKELLSKIPYLCSHCALCLESSSPLLLSGQNLSSMISYDSSNSTNCWSCACYDIGTVQGILTWTRPGPRRKPLVQSEEVTCKAVLTIWWVLRWFGTWSQGSHYRGSNPGPNTWWAFSLPKVF